MMDKPQWASKNGQAVAMELEKTDDYLGNGTAGLLEDVGEAGGAEDSKRGKDKFERNCHIQEKVEAAVSELSKKNIESILNQIKSLTPTELLLLYLKLPSEYSDMGDPLRQPLNPLGSRSEISQTIMWIRTHLEEDPELSLPKQDVYDEYYSFCGPNKIKPLSTADFGKVMKQVYPRVRPRRLGTRGNSRYCYAGLRRRLKLVSPLLPDLSDKPQSSEISCSSADLLAAAWTIVKEWSEQQLGAQFPSLQALACYLVLNLSIGTGSEAANLITSSATNPFKGDSLPSSICSNKHRETQLQLQRKIQQKNDINREQKRKMQLQSPKVEQKVRSKKCKLQSNSIGASPIGDANTSPSRGLQPVCDKSIDFTNLQALPDFSSFQKTVVADEPCEYKNGSEGASEFATRPHLSGKIPIPRLNSTLGKPPQASSPKRVKGAKYKAIQPKPEPCDIGVYNPQSFNSNAVDFRSQQSNYTNFTSGKCEKKQKTAKKPVLQETFKTEIDTSLTPLAVDGSDVALPRERLISISDIDKSALDDYLGTNNSQEHEEELVKYFENKERTPDQDVSTKLSQLRQLLITQHMNMDVNNAENHSEMQENGLNLTSLLSSNTSAFTKTSSKTSAIIPNVNVAPQRSHEPTNYSSMSARRRVSFEMLHQEDAVPPSPNTRRKNFNFTPISPGPLSPTGRHSKCSSTTASPFVSPRNTPVPRSKGNLHGASFSGNSLSVTTRKPPIASKTNIRIKQETDTHNENEKLIGQGQVNELQQDMLQGQQLAISTEIPSYLPMSAPASPKLPLSKARNSNLLQKLLNSNNKVMYTPNYSRSQSLSTNPHDSLNSEISQLFSNSASQLSIEAGYRSQSVPLHQMSIKSDIHSPLIPSSFATQFPFITSSSNSSVDHTPPIQNEFGDFDSFSANENINMNKILSTLDPCENEVDIKVECTKISLPQPNIYGSIPDVDEHINKNFSEQSFNVNVSQAPIGLPGLRALGRSQSIDVNISSDINYAVKYNPSRSVPGTPVPNTGSKKVNPSKSYRSYPSTPLTVNESFAYNHGQDYLLNGQPIKEKVASELELNQELGFFQNSESNDGIYNVDMFNVNDANLNCDILMGDNKNNFSFDGQLAADSNYCAKQNIDCVLDESCVANGGEFNFKNTANNVNNA